MSGSTFYDCSHVFGADFSPSCLRNIKTCTALHPPASLLPHLSLSPPSPSHPNGFAPSVVSAGVRPNGAPVVQLSNGVALSYDAALMSWVRISEGWWAIGSSAWKSRQRATSTASGANSADSRGVVSNIEARIAEHVNSSGLYEGEAEKPRPSWWTAAMTLGHLESRMHAARILVSAPEYKQALLQYSKVIADEGFRGKAEEVLKELYGPVYWYAYTYPLRESLLSIVCSCWYQRRPARMDDNWCPTILGMPKRDLVKEVLTIFGALGCSTHFAHKRMTHPSFISARSKTLFRLAQEYQDLLRKSIADD